MVVSVTNMTAWTRHVPAVKICFTSRKLRYCHRNNGKRKHTHVATYRLLEPFRGRKSAVGYVNVKLAFPTTRHNSLCYYCTPTQRLFKVNNIRHLLFVFVWLAWAIMTPWTTLNLSYIILKNIMLAFNMRFF